MFSSASRQPRLEAALELGEVVGVHGLPEFEHHVLVTSTTGLMGRRPARRRRSRSHSGDAPWLLMPRTTRLASFGQPAGALSFTGKVSCESAADGFAGGSRAPVGCRVSAANFARDAQHRHGIAAIRRDVELEDFVVELHVGAQVRAHRRVGRQLDDAFGSFGQPELLRRTQHAEGIDAAQLRRQDGLVAR